MQKVNEKAMELFGETKDNFKLADVYKDFRTPLEEAPLFVWNWRFTIWTIKQVSNNGYIQFNKNYNYVKHYGRTDNELG